MTGFEDWLVTLHTLIEAKKPLPSKHDGFEQAQHLLGKCALVRPPLYREFSGYGGQQAVWAGRWKAIRQKCSAGKEPRSLKIELYDLYKTFREQ